MTNYKVQMTPGAADYRRWIPAFSGLPMVPARSAVFMSAYREVLARLQWLCHTNHETLLLGASGTGGIEAVMVNAFSPGDRVLVLANGFFGDQLEVMAQTFGLGVVKIDFDWDKPYDIETIANFLDSAEGQALRGVFAVHVETSTGIANDIGALGELLKDRNLLFVVDAVSSLGTCEVRVDQWGIDALVSVSHKGLLSPPILSLVVLSDRFIAAMHKCSRPVHYLDLRRATRYSERSITPWTPNIPAILGMEASLKKFESVGLEAHFEQCRTRASEVRSLLTDLNLALWGSGSHSNGVTAVTLPAAIDAAGLVSILEENYGIVIGQGLGKLKNTTLRFGHYGNITLDDLDYVRHSMAATLMEM